MQPIKVSEACGHDYVGEAARESVKEAICLIKTP